jgi:hypothetical protein
MPVDTSAVVLPSFRLRLLRRAGHIDHHTSGYRRSLMLELNHIIKGEDLLSGSKGHELPPTSSASPVIFDLKGGGLFKIDAPNSDRAQVATLELTWKNS